MPKEDFYISIGSFPDKEYLAATISYKGNHWVEIDHEEEEMKIKFYSHPKLDYWEFLLEEALEALAYAKMRMVKLGPKPPPLKFDE